MSNDILNDLLSTKIKWNCPLYRGGEIEKYFIRIPSINYVGEETGNCPTGSSHTIRVDGISGVEFNTAYAVEVTAFSMCASESEPAIIFVMIEASGKW